MGDTASLGSFIARSSEACAAVVILGGAALVSWVAKGGESARCPNRSLGTGTKNRDFRAENGHRNTREMAGRSQCLSPYHLARSAFFCDCVGEFISVCVGCPCTVYRGYLCLDDDMVYAQ